MTNELQPVPRLRRVQEARHPGSPDRWAHPEWEVQFPWLSQGTTGRESTAGSMDSARGHGKAGPSPDFALYRDDQPTGETVNWLNLARDLEFSAIVGSRQTHGRNVLIHDEIDPDGPGIGHKKVIMAPNADGHATGAQRVLMGVTVADCVPVFLVDPTRRAVALLHAGWRSVVAGLLEAGMGCLEERFGSRPQDLLIHLGPAICGACYEVGPEVHEALGLSNPGEPRAVDLRSILGQKAVAGGAAEDHVTSSGFCTRCAGSPFYSHRGGDRERQVGYLGIRSAS